MYNVLHTIVTHVMLCIVSAGYSNSLEQVMAIKEVIAELPPHNRLMLGWVMVHMSHIVENVSIRATITLYPIGRPVRATITLYPIGRTC